MGRGVSMVTIKIATQDSKQTTGQLRSIGLLHRIRIGIRDLLVAEVAVMPVVAYLQGTREMPSTRTNIRSIVKS